MTNDADYGTCEAPLCSVVITVTEVFLLLFVRSKVEHIRVDILGEQRVVRIIGKDVDRREVKNSLLKWRRPLLLTGTEKEHYLRDVLVDKATDSRKTWMDVQSSCAVRVHFEQLGRNFVAKGTEENIRDFERELEHSSIFSDFKTLDISTRLPINMATESLLREQVIPKLNNCCPNVYFHLLNQHNESQQSGTHPRALAPSSPTSAAVDRGKRFAIKTFGPIGQKVDEATQQLQVSSKRCSLICKCQVF